MVAPQLAALKRGFNELLPAYAVSVFTVSEIDLLLNGTPDVAVEDMRECTVYTGNWASVPRIGEMEGNAEGAEGAEGREEGAPSPSSPSSSSATFASASSAGASAVTIQLFWQVLQEMPPQARAAAIRFATGSPKVPLDGFDPPFTITLSEHSAEALPSSHTCFNQLVLPPYTSAQVMQDKLAYAISNAEGFGMT